MSGYPHFFDVSRFSSAVGIADGATVSFYYTGTTNLAPIYSDMPLTVPLSNPVTVGVGATLPKIYLDSKISYRRRIVFVSDGVVYDEDPIAGNSLNDNASGVYFTNTQELANYQGTRNAVYDSSIASVASAALVSSLTGAGVYSNTYSTVLPQGVVSVTITAAGAGGTAGTYALGVTGGPANFAGTYTIAGGVVTAITITNSGLASVGTAPALTFPLGTIAGATAVATVSSIVPLLKNYWTATSDNKGIALWLLPTR